MGASKSKDDSVKLWRDANALEHYITLYKNLGWDFIVKHSRYSTTIELAHGTKIKMIVEEHSNRTFVANKLVIRDLKAHSGVESILGIRHSPMNYDSANGLPVGKYGEVINIDISSAYATTLYRFGLISKHTYNYLSCLPKRERLVSVGMLAKKSIVYVYEKGECVDVYPEVGKYAEIFFYLINEVDKAMKECRIIADDFYIFHWTDGIFLRYEVDKATLKNVEQLLSDMGYNYKYEKVTDFSVERDGDCLITDMIKNGKPKKYMFYDRNFDRNYNEAINTLNADNNRFKLQGTVADGAGRPDCLDDAYKAEEMAIHEIRAFRTESEFLSHKKGNARPLLL